MTTAYPKNFGAMLNAFMNGWRPNQETFDFQHIGRKVNSTTGKLQKIPGQWIPCRSLTELIGTAQSWNIYDNYVTVQRFARWETEVRPDGSPGKTANSDHDSYRLDRIYTDTDPEDGHKECLDYLPRYRKMQDDLEVDGRSAVWLICSGRGYHTYTYLNRFVSVNEGRDLQDILGYRFNLELDYWTPITRARMMRLPYSKNSRTRTWVLSVGRNMTLDGLRNAMKSELLDGCHWENPARVPPGRILKLHPGKKELDEYREKKREKARAKIRKGMERKSREVKGLLDQGKSWSEIAGLMGYRDERYLKYWVEKLSGPNPSKDSVQPNLNRATGREVYPASEAHRG